MVSTLKGPQQLLALDLGSENASWEPEEVPGNESSEHTFFSLDYQHVQVPFEITLWIMLASLAKIGKESTLKIGKEEGRGKSQALEGA